MIPALFAVVLLALLLFILGHHNEQLVITRWDMTLNPEGLQVYSHVADEIATSCTTGNNLDILPLPDDGRMTEAPTP